jgi:hypothetical protein
MLTGATAVASLAALGSAVLPPATASEVPQPSILMLAIAAHEKAAKAFDEAIDREQAVEEALDTNPLYVPVPKVSYAYMLVGRNADGTDKKEPLYVHSLTELEGMRKREVHLETVMWGGRRIPGVNARFAEKRRDLTNQIRRKRYHELRAGLPAAQQACSAASHAAELAAVAVLLAIPANAAEAATKRDYIRGKSCFTADWWDAESLVAALRANLGEVA